MPRPIVAPDWSTNTNYAAGADPWSGNPTKHNPGGLVATGFVPQSYQAAQDMNFMLNNHGAWINFLNNTSQVSVQWAEWSGAIAGAEAWAGDFHVIWSGANAPVLTPCSTSYNAPYAVIDAPLNTNASTIYSGGAGGLFITQSWLYGIYEVDYALSAAGANNLTATISMAQSGTVSGNFQGACFTKASTDTNWQCKTNDGAATTTTSSGVAPTAGTFQRFKILFFGSGDAGGLRVLFYINDTLVVTHTTNIDVTHGQIARAMITATANNANSARVGRIRAAWSRLSGL